MGPPTRLGTSQMGTCLLKMTCPTHSCHWDFSACMLEYQLVENNMPLSRIRRRYISSIHQGFLVGGRDFMPVGSTCNKAKCMRSKLLPSQRLIFQPLLNSLMHKLCCVAESSLGLYGARRLPLLSKIDRNTIYSINIFIYILKFFSFIIDRIILAP